MPTALLSVFDKSGIVDFATGLHALGWKLLSSGGTAAAISAAGIPVTDVAELTGLPAILDHRVVTLHPKVHGGLLADPENEQHRAEMTEFGIEPIALLVVNLYPFTSKPGIELIDVGGPAMVRAAAKNHAHVSVIVAPGDYDEVLNEIRHNGGVSGATRRRLARDAFAHTATYDAAIVTWFDTTDPNAEALPRSIHIALERAEHLRYGENPHQQGARYRSAGQTSWWDTAVQHGGKHLSYLNLYDTEAAWRLVNQFHEPAAVIVKHANPCGVALGATISEAYSRANACDPVSAFGGVVAVNQSVDGEMALRLTDVFTEVVVAPGFDDDALTTLLAKKNLRVISATQTSEWTFDFKPLSGGLILQQADAVSVDRSGWSIVTSAQPTAEQWDDLVFAWRVCAVVSSNAVVYVKDRQAFGIGAGQQNRLDSARIAGERAAGRAAGGVCASDAFFPFRDGLDAVAAAGISAVIQPGGSVRDDEVIAAADGHGIAMVFTGERHFRH